jgi:hypothetical protein
MQAWNTRHLATPLVLDLNTSSFDVGKYPINTFAWAFDDLLISFFMLPIVMYTGQAFLSPPNCDSIVSSVLIMMGATVEPFGSFFYMACKLSIP